MPSHRNKCHVSDHTFKKLTSHQSFIISSPQPNNYKTIFFQKTEPSKQ